MPLRYVGSSFFVGIPARDLSEDEISDLDATMFVHLQRDNPPLRKKTLRQFLIESGQYVEQKINDGPAQDKALRPGRERK